jgi:uncharacterized membrane protein YgcG
LQTVRSEQQCATATDASVIVITLVFAAVPIAACSRFTCSLLAMIDFHTGQALYRRVASLIPTVRKQLQAVKSIASAANAENNTKGSTKNGNGVTSSGGGKGSAPPPKKAKKKGKR